MTVPARPGAAARADALLEKPPDVGRLLGTIEKLLSEGAEARERRVSQRFTAACLRPRIDKSGARFGNWSMI